MPKALNSAKSHTKLHVWKDLCLVIAVQACLVLAEARKLNTERSDVLTIPFFTFQKGANRRARHGRSEDQGAYHQAKEILRKAMKKNYKSILHRFQTPESYRNSQTNIKWTDDFCEHLDELAGEDATWWERTRQEKCKRKQLMLDTNSLDAILQSDSATGNSSSNMMTFSQVTPQQVHRSAYIKHEKTCSVTCRSRVRQE